MKFQCFNKRENIWFVILKFETFIENWELKINSTCMPNQNQ
jgi:hypothetical protein